MIKKRLARVSVTASGNVFADIGVSEPEEELAKAKLAGRVRQVVGDG